MRTFVIIIVSAFALATAAQAGQPKITVADYMAWDGDEREAYVIGLWDGLMVAETYHETQELAWLTDCGGHGISAEKMTEVFDAHLPNHRDAGAFGVAHAFIYAMADHSANAPQLMKDLAL